MGFRVLVLIVESGHVTRMTDGSRENFCSVIIDANMAARGRDLFAGSGLSAERRGVWARFLIGEACVEAACCRGVSL